MFTIGSRMNGRKKESSFDVRFSFSRICFSGIQKAINCGFKLIRTNATADDDVVQRSDTFLFSKKTISHF